LSMDPMGFSSNPHISDRYPLRFCNFLRCGSIEGIFDLNSHESQTCHVTANHFEIMANLPHAFSLFPHQWIVYREVVILSYQANDWVAFDS
jgi:hypothetical protein